MNRKQMVLLIGVIICITVGLYMVTHREVVHIEKKAEYKQLIEKILPTITAREMLKEIAFPCNETEKSSFEVEEVNNDYIKNIDIYLSSLKYDEELTEKYLSDIIYQKLDGGPMYILYFSLLDGKSVSLTSFSGSQAVIVNIMDNRGELLAVSVYRPDMQCIDNILELVYNKD
ncbi:MAG: hypothetical protein IJF53_06050 [Clostridia bacterium]|nr:hypothetical protein [Clostridia bacterium]